MDEFDGLGPENTQLISQAVFGEDDAVAMVEITPPGASESAEPLAEVPLVNEGDGWLIDWTQMTAGGGEAITPES